MTVPTEADSEFSSGVSAVTVTDWSEEPICNSMLTSSRSATRNSMLLRNACLNPCDTASTE